MTLLHERFVVGRCMDQQGILDSVKELRSNVKDDSEFVQQFAEERIENWRSKDAKDLPRAVSEDVRERRKDILKGLGVIYAGANALDAPPEIKQRITQNIQEFENTLETLITIGEQKGKQ